eukprot:TRINITY_DN14464_c0_g1_i1.p2 TRINITY_DN14464_c0_g1~~TRINITY_DN14464_c0_g1_i1.p2  ORF type:complete len:129 (+),score=22.40 TRINITY_DN14464_c0_g1_i1:136-522(+)
MCIRDRYQRRVHGDPNTVNQWLKTHGGYASGDLLVWGAFDSLGFKFDDFLLPTSIISQWKAGKVIVLNIDKGENYVLMTGLGQDERTFVVNDPLNNRNQCQYQEIIRGAIFTPPSQIQILLMNKRNVG